MSIMLISVRFIAEVGAYWMNLLINELYVFPNDSIHTYIENSL